MNLSLFNSNAQTAKCQASSQNVALLSNHPVFTQALIYFKISHKKIESKNIKLKIYKANFNPTMHTQKILR